MTALYNLYIKVDGLVFSWEILSNLVVDIYFKMLSKQKEEMTIEKRKSYQIGQFIYR